VIAVRCQNGIDPRLIHEQRNGSLVDLSAKEIARAALELLESPDRLESLGATCREFAANFDWDVVARQYEQLYSSMFTEGT
jgi:glycosyltransferase involved in cell wall biosynthesis